MNSNVNVDIESSLSVDEKNAYKALIEGCSAAGKNLEVDNYDVDVDNDIDDLKGRSIIPEELVTTIPLSTSTILW